MAIHALLQPLIRHYRKPYASWLETNSVALMKNMAATTDSVAFQVRAGVDRECQAGTLVFLPLRMGSGHVYAELAAFARPRRILPPALEAIILVVKDEIDRCVARDN